MARISKNKAVLAYLSTGKALTTKKAKKKLGIKDVGKQIYALREQGFNIVSYTHRKMPVGAPRVRYVLENNTIY